MWWIAYKLRSTVHIFFLCTRFWKYELVRSGQNTARGSALMQSPYDTRPIRQKTDTLGTNRYTGTSFRNSNLGQPGSRKEWSYIVSHHTEKYLVSQGTWAYTGRLNTLTASSLPLSPHKRKRWRLPLPEKATILFVIFCRVYKQSKV